MQKYNKLIFGLIVIIVLMMSIGYSVLESSLRISGEINYRPQEDVRITNFTTSDKPNEMTIQYSDFSKHEIKLGYTTTAPCSITYTVEIENFSGVDMGILKIDGMDNSVEVQENIIGTKLVESAGTKTFTITFNSNGEETKTYLLTFDFKQVYAITYNSFDNTENYKKEILKGEEYSQYFGNSYPTNIEVKMGGIYLKNYTYSNGTLTISNVTGNLIITGIYAPSYTDSCDVHPNPPELNGDMIPVVYDEENKTWVKQDLDKSYDYCKQIWANAVTVAETSVKDLSGNYNNGIINGGDVTNNGEVVLDGIDDYVDCGLTGYDFKNSFSSKIKFKVNEFTTSGYILGNAEAAGIYITVNDVQQIYFGIYDGQGYQNVFTSETVDKNIYYDMFVTFNGKEMKIYLKSETENNFKIYSNSLQMESNIMPSTMPFYIGANPNGNDIAELSKIDVKSISIYDREITSEEIENNSIKNDNCLLSYDFNFLETRENFKNAKVGTIIPMKNINTMWVWIPRYSYTIKSEDGGTKYFGKASFGNDKPTKALPGEIDVKFIKDETETGTAQYIGDSASGWRTNETFNFGKTARAGFWIGKFEISGQLSATCTEESCDASKITVLPNKFSLVQRNLSSFFYMARSMQTRYADIYGFNANNGNIHLIKKDEWGAVAYLSQSKYGKYGNSDYLGANKEIYQNKSSDYITGSSNGTPSQEDKAKIQYAYNDIANLGEGKGQAGPGASTTGTIYGVYDMNGGDSEIVMGVLADEFDKPIVSESGFTQENFPSEEYYNKYKSANPSAINFTNVQADKACAGGVCYGHGLSEIVDMSDSTQGWYNADTSFVHTSYPWFKCGGAWDYSTNGGIFVSDYRNGSPSRDTTRIVLVAK